MLIEILVGVIGSDGADDVTRRVELCERAAAAHLPDGDLRRVAAFVEGESREAQAGDVDVHIERELNTGKSGRAVIGLRAGGHVGRCL